MFRCAYWKCCSYREDRRVSDSSPDRNLFKKRGGKPHHNIKNMLWPFLRLVCQKAPKKFTQCILSICSIKNLIGLGCALRGIGTIFPPQLFIIWQGELPFCTGGWDFCRPSGCHFLSHFLLQHPVFPILPISLSRAGRAWGAPAKTAPPAALQGKKVLLPLHDSHWLNAMM